MESTENLCSKCHKPQDTEEMWIIDGSCWKCNGDLKVAIIRSGSLKKRGSSTSGPESFTADEIKLAQSKRVLITQVHSQTMDENYLANTCHCGAFIGQFYLFKDYFHLADMGDYKSERFNVGYHCLNCEIEEDSAMINEDW